MIKEYKVCKEIIQLTPEMLRNYEKGISGDVYQVKRQIMLRCPITCELVPESQCLKCVQNFGKLSDKWIYCLPKTTKIRRKRK